MEFVIRTLTDNDISLAEEMYLSQNRLQRSEYNKTSADFQMIVSSGAELAGAFSDDGILQSYLTYRFLKKLPISIINGIHIRRGAFNAYLFNNDAHPLPRIIDYVLEKAESLNYYTWYYSRADLPIYHKLALKNQDLLRNTKYGYDLERSQFRYERYVDEIVPALGRSVYDFHNDYFGLGKFDVDVAIIKCCLKNEYRKWNLEF
jgi:hypothetical protein